MQQPAQKVSADALRSRLKLKSFEEKVKLSNKHPIADKFFKFKGFDLGKIREHSAKLISSSALAGALLLSPPAVDLKYLPSPQEILEKFKNIDGDGNNSEQESLADTAAKKTMLSESLKKSLPNKVGPLNREEEKLLEQIFVKVLNVKVKANLEGEHLNTTYGYIGAEQHLRRFPGDDIGLHNDSGDESILKEGMAPGLGAWGYFANSKENLTVDLKEKEKWYAVVQTLYLSDWNKRQVYLKDWYKYRKVLIVNVQNGNAVVADIADSGPAAWTGKHYGGSPEVMEYLGGVKYKKGNVIVFFVDDPDNIVPLGPVEYQ